MRSFSSKVKRRREELEVAKVAGGRQGRDGFVTRTRARFASALTWLLHLDVQVRAARKSRS